MNRPRLLHVVEFHQTDSGPAAFASNNGRISARR